MYYISDYRKQAVNKIIPYLIEFPQVIKIIENSADRYQAIEDCLWNLANNFRVDDARGVFLQALAHNEVVDIAYTDKAQDAFTYGTDKPLFQAYGTGHYYSQASYISGIKKDVSDEKLIRAIKAKIIQNNTSGTIEDLIEALKLYFNATNVKLFESNPLNLSIMLQGKNLELSSSGNYEVVKKMLPGCVNLKDFFIDSYLFDVFQYDENSSYGESRYPILVGDTTDVYHYISQSVSLNSADQEYIKPKYDKFDAGMYCVIAGNFKQVKNGAVLFNTNDGTHNLSLKINGEKFAIDYNGKVTNTNVIASTNDKYTIILYNTGKELKTWILSGIQIYGKTLDQDLSFVNNRIFDTSTTTTIAYTTIDAPVYINCACSSKKVFNKDAFTVVGTPTITSDGIASGFLQSDTLPYDTTMSAVRGNGFKLKQLKDKPYTIRLKSVLRWNSKNLSNPMGTIIGYSLGQTSPWQAWSNSWSILDAENIFVSSRFGTSTNNTGNVNSVGKVSLKSLGMILGNEYIFETSYDGTSLYTYSIYETNGSLLRKWTYKPSTADKNLYAINVYPEETFNIGSSLRDTSTKYYGSSSITDLKAFSITVDGEEVFSGSKDATPTSYSDFTYHALLLGKADKTTQTSDIHQYYATCYGNKQVLFNCFENKDHLHIHTKNPLLSNIMTRQSNYNYKAYHSGSKCAYFDGKSGINYTLATTSQPHLITNLDIEFDVCMPVELNHGNIMTGFVGNDSANSFMCFDKTNALSIGVTETLVTTDEAGKETTTILNSVYRTQPNVIEAGEYAKFKVSFDSNTLVVYKNGKVVTDFVTHSDIYNTPTVLRLGYDKNLSNPFKGFLRNVKLNIIGIDATKGNYKRNVEIPLVYTLKDSTKTIDYTNYGVRFITTPQLITDTTNLDIYGNKLTSLR